MDVILLHSWGKLGNFGDVVTVRPGFARNYLIPQGKALSATRSNKKVFEQQRETLRLQQATVMEALQARAAQLMALGTVVLPVKVGVEGKLFGGVSLKDIATALAQKGIAVERKELQLHERSIRHLGIYPFKFIPHPQIEVELTLQLVDMATHSA